MRVALYTDTFYPQINGVSNTVYRLANYMKKNKIPYKIFAPHYPGDNGHNYDFNICRFLSMPFPFYPECRLSIPYYPKLLREMDDFKPDIIHSITQSGIGCSGLRYAKEKNIPFVASFTTNFSMYLKYYKLQYLEEALWGYLKWFHSNAYANFCPSQDTIESLEPKGISNLKIATRGIDIELFSPLKRSEKFRNKYGLNGKTSFLYAGRLAPEKDLDTLVQSANEIYSKFPAESIFVIVGDGPMREQLAAEMPPNTVFTGYLKGEALSEAYASADVFVFPSGTETLGNVVLEAMASGLPVIAVNSGGVKENVLNGYNGIMCRYKDKHEFASAMERFIEDEALKTIMSQNARAYTLSKTWDKVFDKLMDDYLQVIELHIKQNIKIA